MNITPDQICHARGHLPDMLFYLDQQVAAADLRFCYKLSNNRMGLLILSEGLKIDDYPAGREFARGLVKILLGEATFDAFVSDAQLVDYQTWLAFAPGGQSRPLKDLPGVFDPIFSRALVEYVARDAAGDDSQIAA